MSPKAVQTWRIKGQVYTREQLRELKAQGIDVHKDPIVMKFVTKNAKGQNLGELSGDNREELEADKKLLNDKREKALVDQKAAEKKENAIFDGEEVVDDIDLGIDPPTTTPNPGEEGAEKEETGVGTEVDPGTAIMTYDDISFFELKEVAKKKGMPVTNKTNKEEILNFLNK